MLERLWGSTSNTRFIVAIRGKVVKHIAVTSAEQAERAAHEISRRGWDAYFAPAAFCGQYRRQADAVDVGSLWVDLDCGEGKAYDGPKEALAALLTWCRANNVPDPTHIVGSGYGLHCYWRLDAPVPHDVWKPVAVQLKRALRVGGVHADPARTADAASILRVPGTLNHKDPQAPRPVKLLKDAPDAVRLEDFANSLPAVGPQRVVEPARTDEWGVEVRHAPLPEGDAPVILSRCQQLRHYRDQKGVVEEPLWRAALSVLKRCKDGDYYCHETSRGDPRYNAAETQAKADNTEGPATCQHFADVRPGGCDGCPFAGKVTSPVQIAPAVEPAAAPSPDGEPWRVSRAGRYTIQSGGVWFAPPAAPDAEPEPPVHVADYPLWVVEVRERVKLHTEQTDGSASLLEWVSVDGRVKRGMLPMTVLFDATRLRDWLAEAGLAVATWDFKLMKNFISKLTVDSLRSRGVVRYHESLGWYEDNTSFVVGDRKVTGDGTEDALIQNSNPIARLSRPANGSLEGWTAAVNRMAKLSLHKHAFALLASLGSPLLELTGRQSAVLSLAGISAAGKTVSMRLGMSVWGNPDLLVQGAQSSIKAVERQLSLHRHVPMALDETTQYTAKQMASLVYMAANGTGDAKLRRDGSNRDVGAWRNLTYVTTNRAILDWSQQQITEAHRRRVLELFFTDPMDREDGLALYNAGNLHYGLACEPYMRAVIKLRDRIPAMVERAERDIAREYNLPDSQRFGLWTLAAAKVGGAIAQAAGLFKLPLDAIIHTAALALHENANTTVRADEVAMDAITEWLSEHNDHINYWGAGRPGIPVREPVARVLHPNCIVVHRARLNEVLGEAGVSPRACKAVFSEPVRAGADKRVRLSPDAPPVWCYQFNPTELGFELDPPDED